MCVLVSCLLLCSVNLLTQHVQEVTVCIECCGDLSVENVVFHKDNRKDTSVVKKKWALLSAANHAVLVSL